MKKYKIIYTAYTKLRTSIIESGYPKSTFSEVIEARNKKEAEMLFLDRDNIAEIIMIRRYGE